MLKIVQEPAYFHIHIFLVCKQKLYNYIWIIPPSSSVSSASQPAVPYKAYWAMTGLNWGRLHTIHTWWELDKKKGNSSVANTDRINLIAQQKYKFIWVTYFSHLEIQYILHFRQYAQKLFSQWRPCVKLSKKIRKICSCLCYSAADLSKESGRWAPPPEPATASLSTPPTLPSPSRSIGSASGLRDVILIEFANRLEFFSSLFFTVSRRSKL